MSRVPVWWSMIPTTMNSVALNSGVRDEQHPPRGRRGGRAGAEQDHEQAELADRAERQEQLQVVLAKRSQPAEHQGAATRR